MSLEKLPIRLEQIETPLSQPKEPEDSCKPLSVETHNRMLENMIVAEPLKLTDIQGLLQRTGKEFQVENKVNLDFSNDETQDFNALMSSYSKHSGKDETVQFIEHLRQQGLEIKTDEEGNIKYVDLDTFFANYDKMTDFQRASLLDLNSENLTPQQHNVLVGNFRLFERNHKQRKVFAKVLGRPDVQKEFEQGKLTEDRVLEVAQEMSKGDHELAADLERIQTIDAEAKKEQEAGKQAEADLVELEEAKDERAETLNTAVENQSTRLEIASSMRAVGTSITECTLEDGTLRFDVPGIYNPQFADIRITPSGFDIVIGDNRGIFPFDQLAEGVQGIHAIEALRKEKQVETALAMNPERQQFVNNISAASKLFEIAKELPFLIVQNQNTLTHEQVFALLINQIAKMEESAFEQLKELITKIGNIETIKTSPEVSLVLRNCFTAQVASSVPA